MAIDLKEKIDDIERLLWEVAEPVKTVADRAGVSAETVRRMLRRDRTPLFHIAAKLDHTLRPMMQERQKELDGKTKSKKNDGQENSCN